MNEIFEVDDFLKNKKSLWSPSEKNILTVYNELPVAANIEISCSLVDLFLMLRTLEKVGFWGIYLIPTPEIERGVRIIAYKGKDNPCYDTGKFVYYCGGAVAALDDDNHLIFGETRICEKTATIYKLPVYKKLVKVTAGKAALIARLKTDPVPFNCDTFESDVSKLAKRLTEHNVNNHDSTAILYPGPFKILILTDGTMIRRGVVSTISKAIALSLSKTDACIIINDELAEKAVRPANFIDAYKNQGAMCLIDFPVINAQFDPIKTANLTILNEMPAGMIQRLNKLIESEYEYFILIGSDARDLNGCCPSDGVEAANRLVEAGVLQVVRPDPSHYACPVNIYTFSGEIQSGRTKPEFRINPEFRRKVKDHISCNQKKKQKFLLTFFRWSLLLFIAISLMVMIIGNITQPDNNDAGSLNLDLVKELNLPFQDGVLILFFHRTIRCKFCNDMERLARETLNIHFADDLRDKNIVFRSINMELPKYEFMRKKYDLFTSTLVLIHINESKESHWKIISDAWNLTDNKKKFIRMFQSKLSAFMAGVK